MLKKIFISICMFSAFSCMFSARVSAQSYLMGMIDINFCNHEEMDKELDIVGKAGEKVPICVELTNKWEVPIVMNIEFLDSVITADSNKSRACNASDRPKKQFGNFLLPYSGDFILPAKQTIQKEYSIKYPIGFSGLSHGCLAYYIVWSDIENGDMFTVRIRSIKYIDVFVSDSPAIQAIKLSQSPILAKMDGEYVISFWIKNKGNVEEKLHIVSTLSNMFWYQKEFIFDTIIGPNTGSILTTESFILPVYGWPFRFRSKISYTPQFNFNITDDNRTHPPEIYIWGKKYIQTLLFIWTRQSRVVIAILSLIIYNIFRPRKKVSSTNTWDLK